MKLLIAKKTGKRYLVKRDTDEFHTSEGIISAQDLQSDKPSVVSSKGIEFILLTPQFSDLQQDMHRAPQLITPKDVGLILAKTGVQKTWRCLDAGGGSGGLCFTLANVAKQVIVYEINPEHFDVLQKNKALFSADNVVLEQRSVYELIDEKQLNLITLDVPEPWRALSVVEQSLVQGGHLVVYVPNLTQVQYFVKEARKSAIAVQEVCELIKRNWVVEGQILRPDFKMLGHTGFLVFCRLFN